MANNTSIYEDISHKEKKELVVPKLTDLDLDWIHTLKIQNKLELELQTTQILQSLELQIREIPQFSEKIKSISDSFDYIISFDFFSSSLSPPIEKTKIQFLADYLKMFQSFLIEKERLRSLKLQNNFLESSHKITRENLNDKILSYKQEEDKVKKSNIALDVITLQIQHLAESLIIKQSSEEIRNKQQEIVSVRIYLNEVSSPIIVSDKNRTKLKKSIIKLSRILEKRKDEILGFSYWKENINPSLSPLAITSFLKTLESSFYDLRIDRYTAQLRLGDKLQGKQELEAKKVWKSFSKKISFYSKNIKTWRKLTRKEYDTSIQEISLHEDSNPVPDKKKRYEILQKLQKSNEWLEKLDNEVKISKEIIDLADSDSLHELPSFSVEKVWELTNQIWDYTKEVTLFEIGEEPIQLSIVIRAFCIFIVCYLLGLLVFKRFIYLSRTKKSKEHFYHSFARLGFYFFVFLGVLLFFISFNINLSNLAFILGALSIGIGFGLQNIIHNFVSGLILLIERPLKIGDYIEVDPTLKGRVESISFRSTRIQTKDNIDVIIPNSDFINGPILNWTFRDFRHRFKIPFRIPFETDVKMIREEILKGINSISVAYKTEKKNYRPEIWLSQLGENGFEMNLVVWVKVQNGEFDDDIIPKFTEYIESTLVRLGIKIPFPQRVIHMKDRETIGSEN